jgi:hypothetical protein
MSSIAHMLQGDGTGKNRPVEEPMEPMETIGFAAQEGSTTTAVNSSNNEQEVPKGTPMTRESSSVSQAEPKRSTDEQQNQQRKRSKVSRACDEVSSDVFYFAAQLLTTYPISVAERK